MNPPYGRNHTEDSLFYGHRPIGRPLLLLFKMKESGQVGAVEAAVILLGQVDKGPGGGGEEAVFLVDHRHGTGEGRVPDGEAGQPVQIGGAGNAALLEEGEAHVLRRQVDGGGVVGGDQDVLGLHVEDREGVVEQLGQPPVAGQHDDPLVLQQPQVPEILGVVVGAVQSPE